MLSLKLYCAWLGVACLIINLSSFFLPEWLSKIVFHIENICLGAKPTKKRAAKSQTIDLFKSTPGTSLSRKFQSCPQTRCVSWNSRLCRFLTNGSTRLHRNPFVVRECCDLMGSLFTFCSREILRTCFFLDDCEGVLW